ncbi:MAG TPA: hypothetical protein VIJ42_05715 [Stellaceae bacterium]
MKLEQSPTRLAFKLGIPHVNHTECQFDRTTGRVTIRRVMLFWPMKPMDIAIADIARVTLVVDEGSGSETSGRSVYPQIVLKSGKWFNLAAGREKSSKIAVDAMTAFLAAR